jgi:hypothetical protein
MLLKQIPFIPSTVVGDSSYPYIPSQSHSIRNPHAHALAVEYFLGEGMTTGHKSLDCISKKSRKNRFLNSNHPAFLLALSSFFVYK